MHLVEVEAAHAEECATLRGALEASLQQGTSRATSQELEHARTLVDQEVRQAEEIRLVRERSAADRASLEDRISELSAAFETERARSSSSHHTDLDEAIRYGLVGLRWIVLDTFVAYYVCF
jgi:hypothetical protein